MIEFPNGNKYKLVYFDTNFLSEFINNQNNFAANVIKEFLCSEEEYLFCTSFFNILELYKTNEAFKEKMRLAFDKVPIGIVKDYKSLLYLEYNNQIKNKNNVIDMAIGIKPLFENDIHDLFYFLDNSSKAINDRNVLINEEIQLWNKKRLNNEKKVNINFRKNLLKSMNEISKSMNFSIEINNKTMLKYKSLMCMAYIKNEFIYNTKIEIKQNSIIDMYNISILPYVDAYATEKFVGTKISKEMPLKLQFLRTKVYYISDFR